MRKLITFLATTLLLASQSLATTTTTHYGMYKPADGSTSWGSMIRDNFDTIDTQMFVNSSDITGHVNDTVGAHAATAISSTVGGLTCTTSDTVQEFLDCLDLNFGSLMGGSVVTTNTTQTITGDKTFNSTVNFGLLSDGVCHISSTTLTSSAVVNADISSSASITRSKLASGTADHVLINDASGVFSSEAQLDRTRGGTGISSTATFPSSGIVALVPSSGVVHSNASVLSASNVLLASEVTGTLPVANGGTGLTSVGTANQLLGVNSGATANEYKTLSGTSNQITVTHGANSVTLSTPQDIGTGSSPTFVSPLLKTSLKIEDPGAGTNTVTFQAPTLSSGYTLTLPVDDGTANQFLQTNGSGTLAWVTNTSPALAISAIKTGNYTVTSTDDVILGDATSGAFTFTLPSAAANAGKVFKFKRVDQTLANIITITAGSDDIDGSTNKSLATQWEEMEIVSNGSTRWYMTSHRIQSKATAYTPTYTGFGTISSNDSWWIRSGHNAILRIKFVAGTTSATEARITLPSGLTSDNSVIGAIQAVGNGVTSTIDQSFEALIEPNLTYFVLGKINSANAGITKVNGTAVTTGQTVSLIATIPILNWDD